VEANPDWTRKTFQGVKPEQFNNWVSIPGEDAGDFQSRTGHTWTPTPLRKVKLDYFFTKKKEDRALVFEDFHPGIQLGQPTRTICL